MKVLVLITFILFSLQQVVSQKSEWYSKELKCKLSYPSSWDLNEHYPDVNLMIKSSYEDDNDLFREYITMVIKDTKVKSAEMYAKSLMAGGKGPMNGEVLSQEKLGLAKGNAYSFIEKTQQAKYTIYSKYYILIVKKKVYIFSFNGNGDGFDRFLKSADEIVGSFKR